MQLNLNIPYEAVYILKKLDQAGFEGYIVGGAVRDLIINAIKKLQENKTQKQQLINDLDFTTNATPQQTQKIFLDSYYTNEFGTVGIGYDKLLGLITAEGFSLPLENIKTRLLATNAKPANRIIDLAKAKKVHHSLVEKAKNAQTKTDSLQKNGKPQPPPFEITTYRSEGLYSDFRRPDQVTWGKSVEEDLERRDFTINAMALKIKPEVINQFFSDNTLKNSFATLSPEEYEVIDLHNGLQDLAKKIICTVRSPDDRFKEDALRMLRAIRLACQLQFEIDPLTLSAIKHYHELIKKISAERVTQEFLAILSSDQPDRGIQLLHQTDLLTHIMPELTQGIGVEQGGHHDTDVWVHQLDSLKNCPSPDPIVRLATLLHDVGKPDTFQQRNGQITFYNHEIVSSRIAHKIAQRLKLTNDQQEKLFKLVRYHMFHYQPHQTDAAIRRLIKRVGLEYIDDILAVREADRLGSGARKTSWRLEELKERIIEQLNQPLEVTDLAIDGHDLINELAMQPGPKIGQVLNELLQKVLEDPRLNQRDILLKEAQKLLKQSTDF